jgi:hypothetical protein
MVAALPLVAPPPHIRQLTLPSASASCCILFSSTSASCCAVSCQLATATLHCLSRPWLVVASSARSTVSHHCCVASPHISPSPPIPPLLGHSSGWLFHHLPLVWLVFALPLLTPPPSIFWCLCLSSRRCLLSCPSPCHCLSCLYSGWFNPDKRHVYQVLLQCSQRHQSTHGGFHPVPSPGGFAAGAVSWKTSTNSSDIVSRYLSSRR